LFTLPLIWNPTKIQKYRQNKKIFRQSTETGTLFFNRKEKKMMKSIFFGWVDVRQQTNEMRGRRNEKCDRSAKRLALDWSWITRLVNKRLGVQYETRVRERERERGDRRVKREGGAVTWFNGKEKEKEKKRKKGFFFFQKDEKKTKLEKLRCASHRLGSKLLPLTLLGTSPPPPPPSPQRKEEWVDVCTRASSYPVALSPLLSTTLLQTQKVHTKGFKLPASLTDPFSFPSLSLYVCSSFLLHYLFCL
jgi:hypothetical protein